MEEQTKGDEWDVVFPVRRDPPKIHRRIKSAPIGETMPAEDEGVALQAASSASRAFRSTAIPQTRPVRIGRTAMQVLRDRDQAKLKPGEAEEIERAHWNAMRYLQRQALTVSHPNDPAEKEADEMADRVMRMPGGREVGEGREGVGLDVARGDGVQRSIEGEREDEEAGETLPIQIAEGVSRKAATEEDLTVSRESAEQIARVTSSGGKPLENAGFFEERMGADFSGVRVHTGPEAAKAADGVQAKAFTLGRDVVFGEGQYRPETSDGKRLIAHELTHTLQQGSATPKKGGVFAKLARSVGKLWRQVVMRQPRTDPFVLEEAIAFNRERKHEPTQGLLYELLLISNNRTLYDQAIKAPNHTDLAFMVLGAQQVLFRSTPQLQDGKLGPSTEEAGKRWLARNRAEAEARLARGAPNSETLRKKLECVLEAARHSTKYLWERIKVRVPEAAEELLQGLLDAIVISILTLAISAVVGAVVGAATGAVAGGLLATAFAGPEAAWLGALAGGLVGAVQGAAAGLQFALMILKLFGAILLFAWIAGKLKDVGVRLYEGVKVSAGCTPAEKEAGAFIFADAIALFTGFLLQAAAFYAIGFGTTRLLRRLRGSALEKWLGVDRLRRWITERVRRTEEGREPGREAGVPRFRIDAITRSLLERHGFSNYNESTGWASKPTGERVNLGADGRWRYFRAGSELGIEEFTMLRYKDVAAHQSNNFFQGHHPIQDLWALLRFRRISIGALRDANLNYSSRQAWVLLLRDSFAGSPHQIITALQRTSRTGLENKSYLEMRTLATEQLRRARVPEIVIDLYLRSADVYFRQIRSNIIDPIIRDSIFGPWE